MVPQEAAPHKWLCLAAAKTDALGSEHAASGANGACSSTRTADPLGIQHSTFTILAQAYVNALALGMI